MIESYNTLVNQHNEIYSNYVKKNEFDQVIHQQKEVEDRKRKEGRERRKREEEEEKQRKLNKMNGSFDMNEMKQLEEWTKKKCEEVVFDSITDNWSVNTSVFDDRILNKSNLIFIIEDTNNNKFGGYISSTIDKENSYINDSNAFVFSLKSNNRNKEMKKFNISDSSNAFYLYDKSDSRIFGFGRGHDICMKKKDSSSKHFCHHTSFNYEGISNALCGSTHPNTFSSKRIVVIQMK